MYYVDDTLLKLLKLSFSYLKMYLTALTRIRFETKVGPTQEIKNVIFLMLHISDVTKLASLPSEPGKPGKW